MQSFSYIPDTQTIESSRVPLLNNILTALSNSSGTAFPTSNLEHGMFCYRTDLESLYQLVDVEAKTWRLIYDNRKTLLHLEDAGATFARLTAANTFTAAQTVTDGVRSISTRVAGTGDALEIAAAGAALAFLTGSGTRRLVIESNGVVDFKTASHMLPPRGTTADRAAAPGEGSFRYNRTTKLLEFHNGTEWVSLGAITSAPGAFSVGGSLTVAGSINIGGAGSSIRATEYNTYLTPESQNYWGLTSSRGLLFRGADGVAKGYVFHDATGFGLLHGNAGWALRATSAGVELYGEVLAKTGIKISNIAPKIPFEDTDVGTTWSIGADGDAARTYRAGEQLMAVNSSGQIWSNAYGWLHEFIDSRATVRASALIGSDGAFNSVSTVDTGVMTGFRAADPSRFYLADNGKTVSLVRVWVASNCNCACRD